MKIKFQNKLSTKLILIISAFLITALTVYTYLTISNLQDYLTRCRLQSANNMSEVIRKSTRFGMLLNRREDVHQIIKMIGTEEGVEGIRIYNKQGTIILSTDSTEMMRQVDMTSQACIMCHSSDEPLSTPARSDMMRIYNFDAKKRVLGLINPIRNEPDCSSAECHAHDPKTEILGVLDVLISFEQLDKYLAENTKNIISESAIVTLIIALATGFFITVFVNRPLKKLSLGIEELGAGNLNYQLDIVSKDELGVVAARFNDMSKKLDSAHKEIKQWSETLNQKVEEKSEELRNIYGQVMQFEKLASLGKLSATVAHELNNPLEGILTYSKLVSRRLSKEQKETEYSKLIEYLELIADESVRCGKIVKDLLLFSHRGDDEFIQADLVSVIEKNILLINHHLEINKIELKKEFEVDSIMLNCNPQKIQQALMSLLLNAIEAMPQGGRLTIKLNLDINDVTIRIEDQGTGISEKDMAHIFEPFYSTKEAGAGTGLGLAIVYGIINNHSGKVEVENTSIEGTTFKIIFPLTKTHSELT
ncbi:MAG: HAMP domain-containing histidine kinase [Ignavibacteriaceae bacterium]|nr:HAMP domain-containing histidine kinase [Ignavibacteriaceae bacterium]